MTRAELMKKHFEASEWCICKYCMDTLTSRGERILASNCPTIDLDELVEFIEDGGYTSAEDGNEPSGCEWCGELDDLYEVIVR